MYFGLFLVVHLWDSLVASGIASLYLDYIE